MSTDRNQQARERFAQTQREREAARIMQEFARAVSSGSAGAIDRFGQRIEIGSRVLFKPPFDYIYDVVDVAPVLAPGAPAGLVRLRMTLTADVTVPVNQQQMGMCVVGEVEAQKTADAQEPAAPPQEPASPSEGLQPGPLELPSITDEPASDDETEPPTLADA